MPHENRETLQPSPPLVNGILTLLAELGNNVVTLWRDLRRKYIRDMSAIHSTWRRLSPAQRKAVILDTAQDGEEGFLSHRDDAVGPPYFLLSLLQY